jgi:hypothetical protein
MLRAAMVAKISTSPPHHKEKKHKMQKKKKRKKERKKRKERDLLAIPLTTSPYALPQVLWNIQQCLRYSAPPFQVRY